MEQNVLVRLHGAYTYYGYKVLLFPVLIVLVTYALVDFKTVILIAVLVLAVIALILWAGLRHEENAIELEKSRQPDRMIAAQKEIAVALREQNYLLRVIGRVAVKNDQGRGRALEGYERRFHPLVQMLNQSRISVPGNEVFNLVGPNFRLDFKPFVKGGECAWYITLNLLPFVQERYWFDPRNLYVFLEPNEGSAQGLCAHFDATGFAIAMGQESQRLYSIGFELLEKVPQRVHDSHLIS